MRWAFSFLWRLCKGQRDYHQPKFVDSNPHMLPLFIILTGGNSMQVRSATPNDAAAIASIYNQGIEDRVATFETHRRSAEDVQAWFDGMHPILVVEKDSEIIAFASTSPYSARECYAGIAERSVHVRHDMLCHGSG